MYLYILSHGVYYCLPSFCHILKQVTVAYNKDPSPVKLNLGVGAYRTEVSTIRFLKTMSTME